MQDIHALLKQAEHFEIRHIYRKANMAANWLSKFGYSITCTWSTTKCFSTEIREIVKNDLIGRTLVRRSA